MRRFHLVLALVWVTPLFAEVSGLLHPRLSPGGARIVASYHGNIVSISSEGGELKRHTDAEGWDIEPVFSANGERIAFLRTRNFFAGELTVIDAVNGEAVTLPGNIYGEGKMYFSPDGEAILGQFAEGNSPRRLSWLDLSSGNLTPLPIGPDDPNELRRKRMKFAVSHDGEFIVFAIHRDEPDEQGGNRGPDSDLFRCKPDGSEASKIGTWPARIYDLAVSPDNGSVLLVTDLGASHNDIWRFPFDTLVAGAERLTSNFADDDRVSLDPAGRSMLWSDNFGGATDLRIREFSSGHDRTVRISEVDYGEPTTRLQIDIVDEKSGEPAIARVSVKKIEGGFHFPHGALYRLTGTVGHFYADGRSSLELPFGEYEIRVFRGPEFEIASKTVAVSEETDSVRIPLKRWIDMGEKHWFSGENHVHANYGYGEWYNKPDSILLQCAGEDLNVCNTVIANSDGDAIFDREFFLGQLDPRSTDEHLVYFGQEFRSTIWGHMTLSNLSELVEPIMTGFPGTTNPYDVPTNADIAQRTVDRGGTIGYTHPAANLLDLYVQPYAAKGLPVDAALGRVNLMDIHGNTYAGSTQLWYKLLNTGLRVIGSAGTDVFLNRLRSYPPGWARTYVHLPEGLSYQGWIKGQVEGRSFFTNGPMMGFSVNGVPIGSSFTLSEPGMVEIEAQVDSPVPLDRVEVISNGKVVKEILIGEDSLRVRFDGGVEIEESGWIALRAHGPAHPDIVRDPAAHTNPIWISIDDHPNSSAPKDAAFFLKWIDRLEADLKARDRIPTERLWDSVYEQLEGARGYYRSVQREDGSSDL